MEPVGAAAKAIGVLVAGPGQMQSQLLVSALRRRREFRITSCPLDANLILKSVATSPVQVLLLNPDLPGNQWHYFATLRRLHVSHPEIAKVLLLETYDRDLVVSAFRSGVSGLFCFSQYPFRLLCRCIHSVHVGQVWANSEQLQYLLEVVSQVPALRVVNVQGLKLLTPREEQVVALVAEGLSNRDVARELRLSEHTVKKYLYRIFDKLGVSTRVELVLYAVSHGGHGQAEWVAGAEA